MPSASQTYINILFSETLVLTGAKTIHHPFCQESSSIRSDGNGLAHQASFLIHQLKFKADTRYMSNR